MLDATKNAIRAICQTDPTMDAKQREAVLSSITGGAGRGTLPRVISRPEVAELLGVSRTRVDQLARRGAIEKIMVKGISRAIGFSEASVRSLCEGRAGR